MRRPNRKKIPKNLKIDNLKRPSSMYAQEVSNQVAFEVNTCTLVGYRKFDTNSTTVTGVTKMELGTLSPVGVCDIEPPFNDPNNLLYGAVSLPTFLARGRFSLPNSGSMPELNVVEECLRDKCNVRQSLSIDLPAQQRLESLIAGHLGNRSISNKCEDLSEKGAKASTPALDAVSASSESEVIPEDSRREMVQSNETSKSALCRQDSSESDEGVGPIENGYLTSSSSSGHNVSPPSDEPAQTNKVNNCDSTSQSNIDYESLANSLSVALNEVEDGSNVPKFESAQGLSYSANLISDSSVSNPDITKITSTPQSSTQSDLSGSEVRSTADSGYIDCVSDEKVKVAKDANSEVFECTALELLKEEFEKSNSETMPSKTRSSGTESAQGQNRPVNGKIIDVKGQTAHLGGSSSLPELSSLEEDKYKKLVAFVQDKTVKLVYL